MTFGGAIMVVTVALTCITMCDAACVYGNTPDLAQTRLWNAVERGDISSIAKWVKKGADPNARIDGLCVWAGYTLLTWAIEIGDSGNVIQVTRALLANKADVDLSDGDGKTPLMRAVSTNNSEIVRLLVAQGAAIERQTRLGNTPLQDAAYNGYNQTVRILLECKAEVNSKNQAGRDALMCAMLNNHESMLMDFIEAGAWWDCDEVSSKIPRCDWGARALSLQGCLVLKINMQ